MSGSRRKHQEAREEEDIKKVLVGRELRGEWRKGEREEEGRSGGGGNLTTPL